MFNTPTRTGFSVTPRVMWNVSEEKMAAPNNAYYVLTQTHTGLPNAVLFDDEFAAKNTDDLSEGSGNLYYTQARFDTAFAGKSTTDLSEGTNLYYTDARVSANPDVAANTAKVTESTTVSPPLALIGYNIACAKATATDDGFLDSDDWNTFNNKENALTFSTGLTRTDDTITTNDSEIDHNSLANTHNLTTDIDHDTITNTHNLTTDIDHDTITNTHNLTTDIDHNQLTNYAANEHIDWTNASDNFSTTGKITTAGIDSSDDITFTGWAKKLTTTDSGLKLEANRAAGDSAIIDLNPICSDDEHYQLIRLFRTSRSTAPAQLQILAAGTSGVKGYWTDDGNLWTAGTLQVNGVSTLNNNLSVTGKTTLDQSSTTAGVPVLTLDQADESEEFIKFIGFGSSDLTHSLAPGGEMSEPLLSGYIRIYIKDTNESPEIEEGVYWIPFYRETP